MSPPSVLVLGAGELGTAVLRHLAKHASKNDTSIAVLRRASTINASDPSKRADLKSLEALSIDFIEGDVLNDSIETLATTVGRFHTVINCCGMYLPAGTQTKIAQAVLASNCQRYFPWQFGLDYDAIGRNSSQDLFTEQLDVRDLLRGQSKIPFTIISTGLFLSFLFEPAFGIVNAERNTVTALGSWDNRVTVTAPDDIGKVTAEIAMSHAYASDVVYVAGDTVSFAQVADILDRIFGGKVNRRLKTVVELAAELDADPSNGMAKYRVVFAEGVGLAWSKAESFNALNGIETQTVEDFAKNS